MNKILIELSDNFLKLVTKEELMQMENDALEFDGFFGWKVIGKVVQINESDD